MFTFIKKVIKTGTATSSYPLEPIAVDKNFRGKPEQNPQHVPGIFQAVPVRKYHLSPSLPAPAAAPGGQILPPQPRGQFG